MMNRAWNKIILLGCGLAISTGCATGNWSTFGKPTKGRAVSTVDVRTVLLNKEQYAGKDVRVAGTVKAVCAERGCWIRIGCDGVEETLFVKFTCPVDGRLIPMDALGHQAVVQGNLELKVIPEAEARHYKEDAGASAEEIAKIVGPQKIIKLNSPTARIQGVSAG